MPDPPTTVAGLPRILAHPTRRRLFLLIIANGALQAGAAVGVALLARYGIDRASATAALETKSAVAIIGGFSVAALMLLWLRTVEWATAERLGQHYVTAARLHLFDHLNRVSSRELQSRTRGVMMLRFVADLNALTLWAARGLPRVAVAATAIVVAISALAIIDMRLAGIVVAVVVPLTVIIVAAGPGLYKRVWNVRRQRGRLAANIGEKLGGASPVQIYARGRGERARLRKHSEMLSSSSIALARFEALLRFLPSATVPLATGLVLVVGARQLSIGSLLAAVLVLGLLATPLRDMARVFVYLQRFRAARDVLNTFLAMKTLTSGRKQLRPVAGAIAVLHVSVHGSLEDIDADVKPRELIAITGPSGGGKSTLLAVVARLFDPDLGSVTIDGQDVRDVTLDSLRRSVSFLSADLPLQRGSLMRNLRYRAPESSDEELFAVMALCDLESDVARMPAGLNTRISEGGVNLSAGFRQRLKLARAVLAEPKILLIDDADSMTDPRASASLDFILEQRRATTLIVTNEARRIHAADQVWRIVDGKLIGTAKDDGALNVLALKPEGKTGR